MASTDSQRENDAQRQRLHACIEKQVIHLLGQPKGQVRLNVHRLWDDTYRVNVFTRLDSVSAALAHSYFLVTDGEGNIVTANPTITKHY